MKHSYVPPWARTSKSSHWGFTSKETLRWLQRKLSHFWHLLDKLIHNLMMWIGSLSLFFFSPEMSVWEYLPVTINHSVILTVHWEQKKKKRKMSTWESSCSLMCNLAASCSLLCSRPQEVSEVLTKLRLNPWLRSENPSHLATFQKGQPRPEPKSPCDVELPADRRRKSRPYAS